jgi:hypothetical protein
MAMNNDGGDCSDSDSDVAFASMDFAGVSFNDDENVKLSESELEALAVEQLILFSEDDDIK